MTAVLSPARTDSSVGRAFLARYTGTLLPLAAALIALELGWSRFAGTDGDSWVLALAAVCGWAGVSGAWLRHRGRRLGGLAAVVCLLAVLLTPLAVAGWMSPAGLVLWGPVSAVLASALLLAAQPVPAGAPHRVNGMLPEPRAGRHRHEPGARGRLVPARRISRGRPRL